MMNIQWFGAIDIRAIHVGSLSLLFLLVTACASDPPRAYHAVRKGETLYSISWRYGYDPTDVALWNGIRAPYTIYPGQVLRIKPPPRIASAKGSQRPPAATDAKRHDTAKRVPAHSAPAKAKTPAPAPVPAKPPPKPKVITKKQAASDSNINNNSLWKWPLQGKVIAGFAAGSRGNQGMDIEGKAGQTIHAASDGKVVYSGQGLRQLGKLIIIKHDARLLSAYGYNSQLLVSEGDNVRAGQKIAVIGQDGRGRHLLHFEIRRDGIPVDPRRYIK